MTGTAYVVLGMHRSGTSSVAGALALAGATPPRTLMTPKPENPKGFWESEVVMTVNDRLLAQCGSSWDDWRKLDRSAVETAAAGGLRGAALETLGAEFGGAKDIVLKDPRICRFYPFWRSVLIEAGYEPLVVSPIRAPVEVAASLSARNASSRAQGLRLWLRHVLQAEADSRDGPRHLMAWDDFLSDWRGQFTIMSARLDRGLAAAAAGAEAQLTNFLAEDLRHQHADAAEADALPLWVAQAHDALLDLAHFGESAEAYRRLDLIHAAFDAATMPFEDAPS